MKTVEMSILKANKVLSRFQLLKVPMVALVFPAPEIVINSANGVRLYATGKTMKDFLDCLIIALHHVCVGETTVIDRRLVTPSEAKHYMVLNNG